MSIPSDASIQQYMSPNPYVISRDQPLSEAHRIMREKRVRHLPVTHSGRLVGIVSAGDLDSLETLQGIDPDEVRVDAAMTPEPYCVRPSTPLEEVVAAMAANKYGCAIVTEREEVVGIFTTIDGLAVLSEILRKR